MIPAHIEHVFKAFDRIERRESPALAATVRKPLSQDKNEAPTAGIGTADAGILSGDQLVISQYRQAMYAHERLIEKLYDLMPERMDDAYDLVRAEYLAIHGPR